MPTIIFHGDWSPVLNSALSEHDSENSGGFVEIGNNESDAGATETGVGITQTEQAATVSVGSGEFVLASTTEQGTSTDSITQSSVSTQASQNSGEQTDMATNTTSVVTHDVSVGMDENDSESFNANEEGSSTEHRFKFEFEGDIRRIGVHPSNLSYGFLCNKIKDLYRIKLKDNEYVGLQYGTIPYQSVSVFPCFFLEPQT
eukprot:TRINITY_DN1703_c1_g1_i2.p1 TRINITY_DN1703_c1_g1~~TRINITY_DN1703_c1_g1_i2.p1  ORF type:complete len:234 (+),score=72.26 TRINITY_DN1703_c1_g1_i2:102-704(+)